MLILMNLVMLLVLSAAGAWLLISLPYGLNELRLKKRLFDNAIVRGDPPEFAQESIAVIASAFFPTTLICGGLALWPAARSFVAGSWGLKGAGILCLIGMVLLVLRWKAAMESCVADIYDEYEERIREPLAKWQEALLAPYLEAATQKAAGGLAQALLAQQDAPALASEKQSGVTEAEPVATLAFEITGSSAGNAVDAAPFFVDGSGPWTRFSCRVPVQPPIAFSFCEKSEPLGDDAPFSWGDGRIWFHEPDGARRFAAALVSTFLPDQQGCDVEAIPGPAIFGTAVFSRDAAPAPSGGFVSGGGNWVASKWTTEDGSEVFVNWSPAESRGHFSEKDEGYAAGICAAFGAKVEDEFEDAEEEA
jgi:hypothetical protein